MIVREAKKRLPSSDYETLKSINKDLNVSTRDRNIIVHGLVNSLAQRDASEREPDIGSVVPEQAHDRPRSRAMLDDLHWRRGRKKFPISEEISHIY
jgi:hypothetical protein